MKKILYEKENLNQVSYKYKIASNGRFIIIFNLKYNLIFIYIFILILFISTYYLYYLSLEKCLDGNDICGNKKNWIIKKIIETFYIIYFIGNIN